MVLPPGEAFSPESSGAIGLVVHRLARVPGRFEVVVVGAEVAAPFADVTFRGVRPGWGVGRVRRYAAGVLPAVRDADLVEVQNRPDLALYLARRLKAPVTLVLQNDPRGMRKAERIGALAGVVTVSSYLRGRLPEGVAATVVPNCIDLAALPNGPAVRERLVLFAGRVVADKGADAFVEAWSLAARELPGWRAEMIGADRFGPDSPETPFLRELRPRAAAAGVAMLGYRPHRAVLEAMVAAAIVVMPSWWGEPFGLTALEAMASGAALLCSGRGGLAEVVGDAAIPVDPDDPAGMAARIVALARDPGRMVTLGEAGRLRAAAFDVREARAALDRVRARILHLPEDARI